jgi:hypothetical protein
MEDEPAQPALFDIEGPDEDGCVWLCNEQGQRCFNLGPERSRRGEAVPVAFDH